MKQSHHAELPSNRGLMAGSRYHVCRLKRVRRLSYSVQVAAMMVVPERRSCRQAACGAFLMWMGVVVEWLLGMSAATVCGMCIC